MKTKATKQIAIFIGALRASLAQSPRVGWNMALVFVILMTLTGFMFLALRFAFTSVNL